MSWVLVPGLVALRNEFDALAPDRDRASDGSVGDQRHKDSTSDHNIDDGPDQGSTPSEDADSRPEVHAIDVDADLRKPGWSMQGAVNVIVHRHRTGADDRLQNVIYNRKIYSRSWGWTARAYTGDNPHDKHAHFSSRYTTAQESDTRRWGLLAADQGDDLMDAAEFYASAARGARGDVNATAADRTNRNNAVQVFRFALGLPVDDQVAENLPCGPDGLLEEIKDRLPEGPSATSLRS